MKNLFTLIFILAVCSGFSQNKLSDRIYFGGGGGLSAGTGIFIVSVTPQVGYKITQSYSAGVGITYQYVRFTDFDESISNYGWSVFNRYNITQQFFAYGEFERLSFQLDLDNTARQGFNSLFLGLGFSNQLGGRASFNTTVLYNVLYVEGEPSPYRSPWVVRAGIGVGIF